MGQVVESDHIANLRYALLRMFKQLAGRIYAVSGDELREGHSLASFEVGAECRTVHARLRRNIVQSDGVDVVLHDVCADLPHFCYLYGGILA